MLFKPLIKAVVLIFTATISACAAKSLNSETTTACNDPTREQLEDLWRSHGTWHESIFQVEHMENLATSLRNISQDFVDIKHHALQDSSCPFGSGSPDDLAEYRKRHEGKLTLCPAYDILNYDENRIPTILFEKACSCKECGFLGLRKDLHRRHSAANTLGCHPVLYHTKVLRRVNCVNNVFIYKPVMEPLTVACVCDQKSETVSKGGESVTKAPRVHSRG